MDPRPKNQGKTSAGRGRLRVRSVRMPGVCDATGLPVDADPPERRRRIEGMASAVEKVMNHLGIGMPEVGATSSAILAAWPRVAGPELASRVVPLRFAKGILYATVGSDAELFEIRMYRLREIEKRAKADPAFAGLRQIRLQRK